MKMMEDTYQAMWDGDDAGARAARSVGEVAEKSIPFLGIADLAANAMEGDGRGMLEAINDILVDIALAPTGPAEPYLGVAATIADVPGKMTDAQLRVGKDMVDGVKAIPKFPEAVSNIPTAAEEEGRYPYSR